MMNDQYKKMKNLFLRQSYIDAWEDYQRSLRKKSFAQWDYIVLTASNDVRQNIWSFQILMGKELALVEQLYRYLANYQKQKILLETFIKREF